MRKSANKSGKILVKKAKKTDLLRPIGQQQLKQDMQSSDRPDNNSHHALSDISLTSESFIVEKVDNTHNLYDLVSFLKVYLKKLEHSYSLDDLYTFLKTNLKFNGYHNFTVELLERYAKPTYTSCLGVYNDSNALTEPQLLHTSHPTHARSISQLKPSPNPTSLHNLNGKKPHKATKPVQKLLRHLNIFKTLFHIVQRDLVVNIYLLDIPKMGHVDPGDNETNVTRANSANPLSTRNSSRLRHNETLKKSVEAQEVCRQKVIKKIKKYHEILYELNEKLSMLINDHRSCELQIMSPHSVLQAKYLYYKHGEYVLRLTTDIIAKFKMVINISQTVYYLNHKLKENDFGELIGQLDESEYDKEVNFYSGPDNEVRKQYQVLKLLPRKKAQAFQKLPKITAESKQAPGELNRNQVLASIQPNVNKLVNGVEIGQYSIKNSKSKQVDETLEKEKELVKEKLTQKLMRLDSNDSFIRETDSSSITSDNDSVLCFIDDLELEAEMKHESLNNKTILPFTDSFQVQQDTNKLLEQHKVLTKQLEMSNQKLKEFAFHLESLVERAERCNQLKMQLKSDQDLIRIAEHNLKQYRMAEEDTAQLNIKQRLQMKKSANRKQLEKQQDFLAYRFNLNLQDLTLELADAPQIAYEIGETEKKISNLHLIINDLNKYKAYVETKLSKHLLNIQL